MAGAGAAIASAGADASGGCSTIEVGHSSGGSEVTSISGQEALSPISEEAAFAGSSLRSSGILSPRSGVMSPTVLTGSTVLVSHSDAGDGTPGKARRSLDGDWQLL